ncbi:MAG: hypothetical protein UT42_C0007G0008 [Candidatus Falkowbacteria bacterium GW2011_GWA2_39_24]|uniref:Type 4 fimbrial biogenesis protein PilX N-terminal domain-containing protein n=1 Tax=Candidatus Falkowbacteria bacterium GW2011_GWA2_39_24 TaxID=1618634 RepID=A0A0G0RNM1_9BACT|nr:MAG: hypothetical protein UT42_C0007G0008 [Candidatus Falkowbacteria bacterium GW2011_GWA2_39_24]
MKIVQNNSGAVILIIVVMISTIAFLMAYSASLLGLGDLQITDSFEQGSLALGVADSCAEEALYRLRLDNNYNGGNLVLSDGSCIIEIIDPADAVDRQITVTATAGAYNRKIQLAVDLLNNEPIILTWQDISL